MSNTVMSIFVLAAFVTAAVSGCGVRGRPQPPESPPEIGRGQPTFRRATEQFKFLNVPPVSSDPESDDESQDSSGEEADEESSSR
jgi:hypothetical protein